MKHGTQGEGMQDPSWQRWAIGVAGAGIYCIAYLMLWNVSFDQWYLPAGLRLACLILLPIRSWPYVFIGDAAALLITRAPKAEQYSVEWAFLSPVLLVSLISLVPLYFRSRFSSDEEIAKKIPLLAFTAGIWSCIVGMALNSILNGPAQLVTTQNFISYTAGNYLGILMALLPCMLWRLRSKWQSNFGDIAQNTAIAVLMISLLLGVVFVTGTHGTEVQLMPLVFMLLPVVYLTVLHGWPGAAIGTLLISIAISFTLPRTNVAGAFDGIVLLAQIIISVASVGLLTIGNHISSLFDKSASALLSELRAMQALRIRDEVGDSHSKSLIRTLIRSTDLRLRENALMIGAARHNLDSYRYDVAQSLKDDGQYERAMEALATGMQAARTLDLQRDTLYPLEIESHGLYAALMGPAFHDAWRQHARVHQNFRGNQRHLSLSLRLAAYRAIFRAMESMQDYAPSEYDIRARVWRRRARCGVTVLVTCAAIRQPEAPSQDADDAFDELHARAFAFDGVLKRRHPCRIRFMMTETVQGQ